MFRNNGLVVLVQNHMHFSKHGHVEASDLAYGIRVDALWELLEHEGMADWVDGDPRGLDRYADYQNEYQAAGVRNLRSAIRLTNEASDFNKHDKFQQAYDRVSEAIELVPDYWRPYWQRGLITNRVLKHEGHHLSKQEKIDRHRSALRDHQWAAKRYRLGHNQTNIRVVLDFARESINIGRLANDRASYQQAIDLLSNEDLLQQATRKQLGYVLALRGSLKTYTGDTSNALEDLNEAIRLSPNSQDYYRFRSYVWRKLGNGSAAVRDYRRYEELHDKEHHEHSD